MDKSIFSLFLLLSISGAASANTVVNGSLWGSVLFDVTLPSQVAGSITWSFQNSPIAQLNPGSTPQCLFPYVTRCQMFVNGSVTLKNISYDDQGEYTLTAFITNDAQPRKESIVLKVYAPLTPPVLSSNNTNSPLMSGTYVTLQCNAGNQNVTSYNFSRDSNIVCSQPNVICSGSSLNFNPISETDSGSYTCRIENPISSNTSNPVNVTVFAPVSNVTVTSNASDLVWPGIDSVSLRCSARGTDVSYSWSLQGAPISGGNQFSLTNNNSTLIISPVTATDNGSFVCTATNLISNQSSSGIKFKLASSVSAVVLTSNTSGVLWAGQDSVSLNCSAQGSVITFSWSLNGNPVTSAPPYNITQSDSPPNSVLTIRPVSKKDTGPFTCKASNKANSITSSAVNLTINWFPDGNILCSAQPINSGVRFGCSWTGGNPAANVTMIFNGVQNTSTDQVFRNVTSSGNFHGSNLTCNGDQLGKTSSCSLVLDPPSSPGFLNNSTKEVKEGDPVVLTVNLLAGIQSRASAPSSQVLPSTFSWSKGDGSLLPNGDSRITVSSTDYASTLTIDKASAAESGTYECKATNFIGSTTFRFNVNVSQGVTNPTGLSGGAIAGIVIGVLAGVTIIGVIVFFLLKKKKRSSENGRLTDPKDQEATVHYAEVKKGKTNGAMADTGISNNIQEDKDDVKYAEIKFPNNSVTTAPAAPVETVYSDVKNVSKT